MAYSLSFEIVFRVDFLHCIGVRFSNFVNMMHNCRLFQL
jgi:hypothetical protein